MCISMENQSKRSTGIYLLSGSFLMFITMVLHPTGGGFEHLLRNSSMAIISHSLAIFSVPFSGLGFLGLTKVLEKDSLFPKPAFAVMVVGLFAAVLAATVNGLAQPLFAAMYRGASAETIETIAPIFRYNMALNHAFDYILIASMFLSVLFWSIAVLRTSALPTWIGYLGLILVGTALLSTIQGFYFLDLHGFRYFILGWVAWIVCVAIFLLRIERKQPRR